MPSERRRAPVARHMVCSATPGSEDVGPNRQYRLSHLYFRPRSGRSSWQSQRALPTPKERKMASITNVVLVHGGFVDGAGWGSVYKILKNGGYCGSIVQKPTISLQDDAAATQRILATQDGAAVLVGHSYCGAVITRARTPPQGWALVENTALAPPQGEHGRG